MRDHSVARTGRRRFERWPALVWLCVVLAGWSVASVRAQPPPSTGSAPTPPTPDTARVAPQSIEEIRKAALKASGTGLDHNAWQMTGSARIHGADQTFGMVFDDRGRFRMTVMGVLPETDAFDGSIYWVKGPAGPPHRIILQERDVNRLVAWTLTGVWAEKAAPLLRQTSTAAHGEMAILLRPKDGVVSGTLLLDASSLLPKSLRYWTGTGDETWTYTNYGQFGGRMLPRHIVHRSGKQDDVIDITSALTLPGAALDFRMPQPDTDSVEFDATVSDQVELKRIQGYLFVHPKVDGQDPGWFFLDTGADAMCIDPAYAKKLNLTVVGGDTTAGVVGVTHLDICRAKTFQLGPVTLKNPVFLELDLAAISQAFKIPIAGICGYDFIVRTVLDIDPHADVMRVFRPGSEPSGVKWTKISFEFNTPCLECRFADDHKGIFSLDTGSSATVDFFTPAVEKFHLLEKQDGTKALTGGAGGTAESRQGKIDWFELGGTRIEKPTVGFQRTKAGVFASPYRVGNIGMGLMGQFRLLLDYEHERIAFVPVPPAKH